MKSYFIVVVTALRIIFALFVFFSIVIAAFAAYDLVVDGGGYPPIFLAAWVPVFVLIGVGLFVVTGILLKHLKAQSE